MVLIPKDRFQKSWLTSSGVAFHLTTPSEEETDRLIDCASRRLACLSTIGAWQSQSHPMFRGPSWVDHSWRPALLFPLPKKRSKPRRARGKINSSGASSRLAPKRSEEHLIACRRRSVLPSTSAPSCRCRPSGEAGTSVPITQEQCTSWVSRKSEKYESYPVDNGDIGNNSRNKRGLPIRDAN